MLLKISTCQVTDLYNEENDNGRFVKMAAANLKIDSSEIRKIVESEVKRHPTALFFKAKAIVADEVNSNGDYFPSDELIRSYSTFVGVPFYTNHQNQDIENAKGKIIHAEWSPKDKAVYVIGFVDREAYPHICRGIEQDYMRGVSMGAINGASMVLMANGSEKAISEVIEGDIVRTPYGNNCKVLKTHCEFLAKDMYQFSITTYHKSPLFTDDHPILVIDKQDIENAKVESLHGARMAYHYNSTGRGELAPAIKHGSWRSFNYKPDFKESRKVEIGDYLTIPSKFNLSDGESAKSDFNYLIGAFLGDGYLLPDRHGKYEGVAWCIGLDEIELAEKIVSLLKKYSSSPAGCHPIPERNGMYIKIYDRSLASWIESNVGTGSKNKRIKFDIKFQNDARQLLAGLLDTDGCIVDKTNQNVRGNKFGGFQISSANLGLLEDVQSLLIALGDVSRISKMNRKPSAKSVVQIGTTEYTLSTGSNSCGQFVNSIKYENSDFTTAKIKAGKSFVFNYLNKKFMACPVKDVFQIKFNEPVYDLTVEKDECYVADGISVHNCSVEYSLCSICHNKSSSVDEYCTHIKEKKSRKFSGKAKDVITGEIKDFKDAPVYEINYGTRFIELSGVGDPACRSCMIDGVINNQEFLQKAASVNNNLLTLKTSALKKTASQQEVEQLNQCLSTLEQICVNLIKNRQKIETEFASDLVNILSDLQKFTDELVGAGFAQLQDDAGGTPPADQGGLPDAGAVGEAAANNAMGGVPPAAPAAGAMPVSQSSQIPGTVMGEPSSSFVKSPTAPIKPISAILEQLNKFSAAIQNELGEEKMDSEKIAMLNNVTRFIMSKGGDVKVASINTSGGEMIHFDIEDENKLDEIAENLSKNGFELRVLD